MDRLNLVNLNIGQLRDDRPHFLPSRSVRVSAPSTSALYARFSFHITRAPLSTASQFPRGRRCIPTPTTFTLWFGFGFRFWFSYQVLITTRSYGFWLNRNRFVGIINIRRFSFDSYFCTITICIHDRVHRRPIIHG